MPTEAFASLRKSAPQFSAEHWVKFVLVMVEVFFISEMHAPPQSALEEQLVKEHPVEAKLNGPMTERAPPGALRVVSVQEWKRECVRLTSSA